MNNYVIWGGKDSRDIKGLLISELPPITKPNMRVKETVIDGVDGSIIEDLGYESYDKTIAIGLKIGADLDKIIEFFTGNGEIVFSNEPDKYYIARIIKNIDYERLLRYRVAKVIFRVQPFKYNRVEVPREATSERQSMIVENIGNHTSKPLITLRGAGTVELSINDTAICQYTFPSDENTVLLDSEKQDAYWGDTLKNRNMYGEFPVFEKGNNVISWSGSVESIQIKKYSRWV
jgi:predicted phage tail component-like protein